MKIAEMETVQSALQVARAFMVLKGAPAVSLRDVNDADALLTACIEKSSAAGKIGGSVSTEAKRRAIAQNRRRKVTAE